MARLHKDWIESYLHLTRRSEPPEIFKKWCAISVLASALERKCYIKWGTLTFYPNMYVVLVAPSGRARKGTAMGPALDFTVDINVRLAAEAITREALIRELKSSNENTIHHETGEMELHSSLTVHSQELTVFLGYQNHQLMSDLADWYDCRRKWTYRTKGQGTDEIIGVWVNIIGATTPELLQTALPIDAIGLGLTSRIVFVYADRKGHIEPAPFLTKEDYELRQELLNDLIQIKNMQGQFYISDPFIERWTEWYLAQEYNPPFKDTRFSGYIERRPTHVMKLSMILHASRSNSMRLEVEDLNNAIKLIEETEIPMPKTLAGVGESDHAGVMSRVMALIGNCEEITFGELMDIFKSDSDVSKMENILATLEATGFVRIITGRKIGQTRICYNVNSKGEVIDKECLLDKPTEEKGGIE